MCFYFCTLWQCAWLFWHLLDGTEDPATTPFLEIADQKGNPIHIPLREKKVTEFHVLCSLQGLTKFNLLILLQTRKDCEIPFVCLNSAVIYPGSLTSARNSGNSKL